MQEQNTLHDNHRHFCTVHALSGFPNILDYTLAIVITNGDLRMQHTHSLQNINYLPLVYTARQKAH